MHREQLAHRDRISGAWARIRRKRPGAPLRVFRAMHDRGDQPDSLTWTEDDWVRWVVETFRPERSEETAAEVR